MRRQAWIAALALALTPGCFTLDFDGDGVIDRPPPSGYEVDSLSCSNGRDDDQDGRIDCQDEDCLMRGHCGEQVPLSPNPGPEDRFDFCSDGVDNDGDGQFDCGDRGCQDVRELCCLSEFDDATCSDGIDNDGNGFADCTDFSCRNGLFVTVCGLESDCTDRVDNDGDRLIDCRDRDCAEHPACAESDCDDGVDNDDNGAVDCMDAACVGTPECPRESDCTNGIDDNGDGRIDCADPSCASRSCSENTAELCSDGVDNDGNGYTDCVDRACADFCELEDTAARCMDGIDNDGNGYTDCGEFSCFDTRTDPPSGPAAAYCATRLENTFERCTDDLDNDGNGFTDCDDNSCRFAGDPAIRDACESSFRTCTNRLDDNDNGFRDCADFSCRFFEAALGLGCTGDADCGSGQSCFRGDCIALSSPCVEGVDLGNEGLRSFSRDLPSDATVEERRRMAVAGCTDGEDNDQDGFVDCEDWDCNHNPLVVELDDAGNARLDARGAPIPLCRYARGRTCLRGPRAGEPCGSDADCGDLERSCSNPGVEGQPFVCP